MMDDGSAGSIERYCLSRQEEAARFLMELIAFESVSGNEKPALRWLARRFRPFVDICELIPFPESLARDPEFSFTDESRPTPRGRNLRMVLDGGGAGSVIFNTHIDVVPPAVDQENPMRDRLQGVRPAQDSSGRESFRRVSPFAAGLKNGHVYGRGACDAKGQVAALWLMVRALKEMRRAAGKKVIIHIAAEEETGGSGTLALVRRGDKADLCVNLEPCSLKIATSVRGAVWFVLETRGEAGHSGSADPKSALKTAVEAMGIIEGYHSELLQETAGHDPLFAVMADPMPVTFGRLTAGEWPAMVPQSAVLSGVFGFLTTPKEEVMEQLASRLHRSASPWLQAHHTLRFPYRHDMSRVNPELPAVRELSRAFRLAGLEGRIGAMPASSDAWFYTDILGVPAVCTGCGELSLAHSRSERVRISDIAKLASALTIYTVGNNL